MTETTFEVDGIDFICPVSFDPGTASTLVGSTVKVYAVNISTGTVYTGTGSIISATVLRATLASGALPVGTYLVQVIVTPLGYQPQTVHESEWKVKRSLGAA